MGYFDKFNKGEGIPFMDGRTKVDIPVGKGLHLKDYGFIKGDDAPFAVMLFEEVSRELHVRQLHCDR